MKKTIIEFAGVLMFSILLFETSWSQQKTVLSTIEDYILTNQNKPTEKIFLHLDRTDYLQVDTIWFKAYSWFGFEQIPDTISKVLYVELLDKTGICKLSKKYLIKDGMSVGNLDLDTTIAPGNYNVRAYTKWMKNLNTGEPFYQKISISPVNQNFQLECNPFILRQFDHDSLKVNFRFFEIDQKGDFKNSSTHNLKYKLRIGTQLVDSGQVIAQNTVEHFFKKDLSGIDINETKAIFELSIDEKDKEYKKQFEIPIRDGIDIQFFPEGGTFVNGIQNRIAFKAIGTDGLSREVKGVIETNNRDTIAKFESIHKGMGSFYLKPDAGKVYYAHLLYNKRNYVIPLPTASDTGSVLMVNSFGKDDYPQLTIKCNNSGVITRKYIIGSTNGKIWFSAQVKLINDSCFLKVPLNFLPEGICRLTVLSEDFKPECERLIYVDKNERFKIELKTDSSNYGIRSKVGLSIKATDLNGAPVQTNLSLAVVDKEQIKAGATMSGITAYKLLESELQGNIEDPGFYFKNGNCSDYDMLDLLLLTQGYRKFMPDTTNSKAIKYRPERNLYISGNLKKSGSKSHVENFNYSNLNLTLLCQSEHTYVNQFQSDNLGQFDFQLPLLFGNQKSLLQVTTPRGKKFYGEIILNETKDTPKFPIPIPSDVEATTTMVENVHQMRSLIKKEFLKYPSSISTTYNLSEVVVKAKDKNWYKHFDKDVLKIVNLDSIDPDGNKYKSLNDLLMKEFGARDFYFWREGINAIRLPCISSGPDYYFPIYVVNGAAWFTAAENHDFFFANLKLVSQLQVNNIKKINILPPKSSLSFFYADKELAMEIKQSLVVIETYNKGYRGDPAGNKSFILEGLDSPRQFYSPRYDRPNIDNQVFDGRTTLFWAPSIKTDVSGNAKVEFYTSDRKTSFDIIVNGIQMDNGSPGHVQMRLNSSTEKNLMQ